MNWSLLRVIPVLNKQYQYGHDYYLAISLVFLSDRTHAKMATKNPLFSKAWPDPSCAPINHFLAVAKIQSVIV